MSILALFMAFLLFPPHACNGRLNFAFVSYSKDIEKAKLLHEKNIKLFPIFDKEKALLGDNIKSVPTLEESKEIAMKGLMEKPRFMLESASAGTKQNVHDVVVTDYVQPHRKSPIHNHH